MRDFATGFISALVIALLGLLAIREGRSSDTSGVSVRDLGTLLALLFGILSAVWWHQSANLANELIDTERRDRQREKNANTLSGAAATATALALIASVFTGLPWPSQESRLCALGFLLLVLMSGDDIRQAVLISMREHLRLRALMGFAILSILLVVFIWNRFSK